MKPFYENEAAGVRLYCGDCREVLPLLPPVDLVFSDPPYPNGAGHFLDGIDAARIFMAKYSCDHWLVFWDELQRPPVPLPLVAIHIWHRSNTNRPDNYEPIYEFHADGAKRASRCFSHPVVYPGLTGCIEATGHPTQKNERLMVAMMKATGIKEHVLDPFMGSGTTGVACVRLGRHFTGIEIDERYAEIAARRIQTEIEKGRLFDPAELEAPRQHTLAITETNL